MKLKIKTLLALFLIVSVLLVSILSVSANNQTQNSEIRYTQKVVSVVYDNSGSMQGQKNDYSLYALQM